MYNGTRVYVHETIYYTFIEQLKRRTELLTVGDPMNMETQIGALISKITLIKSAISN
ncbi:aldehyde dehydrogenase family protein [Photobacterium leiognathi]|uniref:aldehyde dehydrogenase family protein n=1 Tax=Photobacterium leiognathi TaxID=553611 RepID=UPI0034E4CC9D